MKKVAVSFLGSKNTSKDIDLLEATNADYIHIDYMDGKFVKGKNNPYNLLVKKAREMRKRLDVHLMASKPINAIDQYASLNCEYITVHVELKEDILSLIERIKSYGIKAGLAVNPETDIEMVYDYLDDISQVLIMSVKPGASGQEHIDMSDKIKAVKKEIGKRSVIIAIDGGMDKEKSAMYPEVDLVVSASYVIFDQNFQQRIDDLR